MDAEEITSWDNNEEDRRGSSPEFYLLHSLCIPIVKQPTEENLKTFREGLPLIANPSQRLAKCVLIPFAINLRRLSSFR